MCCLASSWQPERHFAATQDETAHEPHPAAAALPQHSPRRDS
jgi:hypothetical protein